MADGGGDHEEQPGGGGEGRRNTPGRDKRDHPVRQLGDLRIGQHQDVRVHGELIAGPAIGLRLRRKGRVGIAVILDTPVAIFILKAQEPRGLPGPHPAWAFGIGEAARGLGHGTRLERGVQVQASEGAHGRRRGVEHGDEGQGPKGAAPGIGDLGDREEAHDHMGKACGPGHERGGHAENVEGALRPVRIGPKAQLRDDPVELFQHR